LNAQGATPKVKIAHVATRKRNKGSKSGLNCTRNTAYIAMKTPSVSSASRKNVKTGKLMNTLSKCTAPIEGVVASYYNDTVLISSASMAFWDGGCAIGKSEEMQ
jgi:hypothetical protein